MAVALAALAVGMIVGHGSLQDLGLRDTLLRLRAARVSAAFLTGAALACSGAVVQALFRNPLVDPSILGTTAGASLGGQAALLTLHFLPVWLPLPHLLPELVVPLGCLAGALVALLIVLAVTERRQSLLIVLLTGFTLSSLFLSFGGFLLSLGQESWEVSRALVAFSLGGLGGIELQQLLLALPLVAGGVMAARFWSGPLDLLLTGEDEARSLGLDVRETRRWSVVWVAFMTAAAVSLGGNIGFVGLIVPHALRPFVGVLNRHLVLTAAISGGVFVVLCDALSRALPSRSEIPIGVITGLIGAPVFLFLLYRSFRESERG